MAEEKQSADIGLDTYEIIRARLHQHRDDLQARLRRLMEERLRVFGGQETRLIANDRILTEHSCISHDIVSFDDLCIFGYNVHFGLRSQIGLEDVFSVYRFRENKFEAQNLDFIRDTQFETDFVNLYKYYRSTFFTRFSRQGNYLHMVFQISDSPEDVKTFKWLITDEGIEYIDNRSEHEYRFPPQQEFQWTESTRDAHRYGEHSHVSVLDKVFVEAIGGDLTIKIEDNTQDGRGIYNEPVEYRDQTLDDGRVRYAEFGNLIALEITPFQEDPRYFVYNHKLQIVRKIDSIQDAAIYLPDEQGLIFPTGYFLQTGEYHLFDNTIPEIQFVRRVPSPNGEDHLFVFYSPAQGLYNLMHYNVISQKVNTPIICNGYTIFGGGELCYFRNEQTQTKHHLIQIWQTPFSLEISTPTEHHQSMLFKIGNKDIVKAMADANGLITLLNQGDHYNDLYVDIARSSKNILDSYYWIGEEETQQLDVPIRAIMETAHTAIDEFERVVQLRQQARDQSKDIQAKAKEALSRSNTSSFASIDDFVQVLYQLRTLRGEIISLRDIRYIDLEMLDRLETEISERQDKISQRCVDFLLDPQALQPYLTKIETKETELQASQKTIVIKQIEEDARQIGEELEMLIEIVSNLKVEDTAHSTQIIDSISLIYTKLNQLKASAKNKKQNLGITEAKAQFSAQIKLIDQSVFNYFDLATTPEKCDEYQSKIAIQLEELEARFIDYEDFILEISEKREEIFASFDTRRSELIEKKNRRSIAIETSSLRIVSNISNKLRSLGSEAEINAFFATDLMIDKLRSNIATLRDMQDQGRAESIETALKVTQEDALRQLKDKQDLFEDGDSVIRLGKHRFGVNQQKIDLTIVLRDDKLHYHITGSDFYQPLPEGVLEGNQEYWRQEYVSENKEVYRSEYLAYKLFGQMLDHQAITEEELQGRVRQYSSTNYTEGYTKGIHDEDAILILSALRQMHISLGLLGFSSQLRAKSQFFWHSLDSSRREYLLRLMRISGEVNSAFAETDVTQSFAYQEILTSLSAAYEQVGNGEDDSFLRQQALYLVRELKTDDRFVVQSEAFELKAQFEESLRSMNIEHRFAQSDSEEMDADQRIQITREWVSAFLRKHSPESNQYIDEIVCLLLYGDSFDRPDSALSTTQELSGMRGQHRLISDGVYWLDYHEFIARLREYSEHVAPGFVAFRQKRHQIIEELKSQLQLENFKPKVLSSFVRNSLIDQVYLPLFGTNLAKQIGTVGQNKRVDRMGLLLLISPPGYGKTTLMEYIANRLGLIFVKINGPAIGHQVTSVDPASAPNSTARQELVKLNMAFEMGNNVMLYLDDIQHCHPEFLQKFISLSDGTRRIEGVYNDRPQMYDLRSKKFCVIMAGNPYTESGERFQIPDMLANRADIYNLGDIIGNTKELFELSLIENSLSSNSVLQRLRTKSMKDFHTLLAELSTGQEGQMEASHTAQDLQDYRSVLSKVLRVRDTLLKVNATYIESAAMEDAYRTEPAFKLQGSYRDMNKLVEKIVPIMNDAELETLLLTHYESESQTLTSAAEANLLKYKELTGTMTAEEQARWGDIKTTFVKNNRLKGLGDSNQMSQIIAQMIDFGEHLKGIEKALNK